MPQIIRDKRFVALVSIILFSIVGVICFWAYKPEFSSDNTAYAIGENWYSTWNYRKPVTITNPNGWGPLTNFQVKLSISYVASKMNANFSDLRFTTSNGSTLLSYWVESYVASTSAIVWVKIDSVPTGDSTIYMYYGNAGATSASSASATFIAGSIYSAEGSDAATYPANHADFNTVRNTLPANIGTKNVDKIYWGSVWDSSGPTSTSRDHFYSRFRFLFVPDTTGSWTFAVDSDDASEMILNPQDPTLPSGETVIASWYSSHGWCNCTSHSGAVSLTAGNGVWMDYTQMDYDGNEAAVVWALKPGGSWLNLSNANFSNMIYARQYAAAECTGSFGSEQLLNGVCGSSNGGYFLTAPSTDLCSMGTPSAVSGSGPFTWTCAGAGGGSTANCSSVLPGANWYSTSWLYRKPVTISNTSGGLLTDFQVKFDITFVSGKMKSDFSDLIFTRGDGSTVLPYWIESYVASTSAVVWVKVNSIPTSNSVIYMYYGNSGASAASNGDNTFILFDDFNTGSLNTGKWATGSANYSAVPYVNGTYLYSNGSSTGGSYWRGHTWAQSVNPIGVAGTDGLRVDASMYANTGNYVETLAMFYIDNTKAVSFSNELDSGFYGHELHTYEGGSANVLIGRDATTTNNRYGAFTANTWETVGLSWTAGGAVTAWYEGTSASPRTYATTGNIYLRLDVSNRDSGTTYSGWDSVRVRKYIGVDSTGSFGSEQALLLDGFCGSSNGGYFLTAPSTDLCSTGTPSAVSGSGPFTWSCVGIGGGSTANCSSVLPGANWYSTSWLYRKPVTISNTSGGLLTDFQVKFDITFVSGKMKSDFSDLIFTRGDGSTVLPYWIESYVASTSAVVWVKVNSIPTSNSVIYMYYGNSGASAASNGDNTFQFFDDFTGAAIDPAKWTIVNSTGFSVSGGQLHGTNTNGRITSIATFNPGVVLDIKEYRTGSPAANGHGMGGFWISDANGIGWLDHPGTLYYRNDAAWVNQGGPQAPADTWRKSSIAVPNSTQAILNSINYSTGATIWNPGTITNAVSAEPISLGPRPGESATYQNQTYSAFWDWIYVRKYASADPTGSLNSEQAIGACGSSDGGSFYSAPTTNLCSSGTASAVSGSGPFTWTCTGSIGPVANCSASLLSYTSTVYSGSGLSCSVTNQTCSGATIFRMSSHTGGHAELQSQSNYIYKVCCTGTGISNLSSGTVALRVSTNLGSGSNGTDAHVETPNLSNAAYSNNAYLSTTSGTIECGYSNTASCASLGSNYACLAALGGTSVGGTGATNAHVAACDQSGVFTTTGYICCRAGVSVSPCTAKVASDKSLSLANTNIQLCSGTDTSAAYGSDPCYHTCWASTGQPDVSDPVNWKCSVCHDNSDNPVSCSTLAGSTYTWTLPVGYTSPADYTMISGTLSSANPIIEFADTSASRRLTLGIVSGNGPTCSAQSAVYTLPTWKPITPF